MHVASNSHSYSRHEVLPYNNKLRSISLRSASGECQMDATLRPVSWAGLQATGLAVHAVPPAISFVVPVASGGADVIQLRYRADEPG